MIIPRHPQKEFGSAHEEAPASALRTPVGALLLLLMWKNRDISAELQLSEACQDTPCDEGWGRRGGTRA